MSINWSNIVQEALDAGGREVDAVRASNTTHTSYAKRLGLMAKRRLEKDGTRTLVVWIDPSNPPRVPGKVGRPSKAQARNDEAKNLAQTILDMTDEELQAKTNNIADAIQKGSL